MNATRPNGRAVLLNETRIASLATLVKHFSWILTIPLTLVVVIFAIANREFVPLDLWPFGLSRPLPIFVLILGGMFVGFLIGALVMWLSSGKQRKRAREARHQVAKLERRVKELERAQAQAKGGTAPPAPVPIKSAAETVRGSSGPSLPAA